MKLVNGTGSEKIDQSVAYFMKVMPDIIKALKSLDPKGSSFTYTQMTNAEVIERLENEFNSDKVITVQLYTPMNPWTAAIGYSNGSPNVFINSRKLETFNYLDYAGTIGHEFCHWPCMFQHGDNYPSPEKDMSVPYAIGNLVSGESSYPLGKQQTNDKAPAMVCTRPWKFLKLKKVCEFV